MTLVNEMVAEQVAFLKKHGYGPVGMNNTEGPALFEQQLREQLEEILHTDDEWVADIPIKVLNVGKFDGGKQTVQFYFDYVFDPVEKLLRLTQLEGVLGDVSLPVPIHHRDDLLEAAQMFDRLLQLKSLIIPRTQTEYIRDLNILVDLQKDLLYRQGYHEENLGNGKKPGSLARRLENKVLICSAITSEVLQRFQLHTKGVFAEGQPAVDYTIHYQFHVEGPVVRPVSVTARLGGQSAVQKCSSAMPLPSARHMYEMAKGNHLVRTAIDIINHSQGHRLKPATTQKK